MKKPKKILSTVFKVFIGLASFGIIFTRLHNDLTPDRMTVIGQSLSSYASIAALLACALLIPVNWGIESYKWQLITAPVERISYRTATKSVYSGICLGNLAPARATEFVAKILYFGIRNRPQVAVLHFLSGTFQLSVTVLTGFGALLFYVNDIAGSAGWILYLASSLGAVFLVGLCVGVYKADPLINYLSRKISRDKSPEKFNYRFSRKLVAQMLFFSLIRYLAFYIQFALLLFIFLPFGLNTQVLAGIALYFLVTTFIPMISVIEGAIRAAVALVVFRGSGISDSALALSSVVLWLLNIIVPSLVGYYFLLRQNFNFKLFRAGR